MNFAIILNILVWLLIFACSKGESPADCPDNQRTHSLILKDSIQFPLDTLSNAASMQLFYNEIGDQRYFGFYNPFVHTVYVYDYSKKELLHIINFDNEGPNGVSGNVTGVCLIDSTTIALVEKGLGVLKIFDFDARIIQTIRLFQGGEFGVLSPPSPKLSRPIIRHEDKLYLTGFSPGIEHVPDHTNLMNAYLVDLTNDSVEVFLPRPVIYNTGQYGFMRAYQIFSTLNLDHTGIIFGFGLTPDIFEMEYTRIDSLTYHCLKSDYIDVIQPFARDEEDINPGQLMELRDYDENISYYTNLYSLPETRHYVRINSIGPNFDGDALRKTTISIFDEKFQKLGETSMEENIRYGYNIFANDEGLHFMKKEQNEDDITFYIYRVVPSE